MELGKRIVKIRKDNKLNQDKLLEEAKSYLKYTITKPISNLYGLDSTLLAS